MSETMTDDLWIDRLADGELTAAERQALFARLDADPGAAGWRRCALAFLEAQLLREALRPARTVEPSTPLKTRSVRRPLALASAAAGLIAAFGLGRVSLERAPAPTTNSQPAAVAAATEPGPPVVEPPPTIDRAESEWGRRGYELERRRRTVSLSLRDGRTVAVPVNEVRFKYVGDRTY